MWGQLKYEILVYVCNYLQKSVFVEYILGWLISPWDWEGVECPKPEVVKWSEKWSEDGWGGLENPCRVGRVGLGGRVGLEVPEVSEVAKSLIMKSSWLEVWDSWLKCSDSPCMKSAWGPNAPPRYLRANKVIETGKISMIIYIWYQGYRKR